MSDNFLRGKAAGPTPKSATRQPQKGWALLADSKQLATSDKMGIPDEIMAYHVVSAMIGLGIWWLENNQPYPSEEIAQWALRLSLMGIFPALGLKSSDIPLPNRD